MGVGALVWRYIVLLPLSEQRLGDEATENIADADDIDNLRAMLSDDFGGTTILVPVMGYDLRDPQDPTSLELNRNLPFLVYANPVSASDRYFDRVDRELREAFNQGVILIERQEAFLFAFPLTVSVAPDWTAGGANSYFNFAKIPFTTASASANQSFVSTSIISQPNTPRSWGRKTSRSRRLPF